MSYDPSAHEVCRCAACLDWQDGEQSEDVCFSSLMRHYDDNGHGLCIDPWNLGCTCTGTSADGDCEACWLWLK